MLAAASAARGSVRSVADTLTHFFSPVPPRFSVRPDGDNTRWVGERLQLSGSPRRGLSDWRASLRDLQLIFSLYGIWTREREANPNVGSRRGTGAAAHGFCVCPRAFAESNNGLGRVRALRGGSLHALDPSQLRPWRRRARRGADQQVQHVRSAIDYGGRLSGLGGDATGLGGPDTTPGGVGVENPTTIGNPDEAPGGAQGAVDWFMPADGEEGPEETVAAVDAFTPAPVGEGPEETVAAVDAFTPAPGEEGPEETVAAVDAFTPAPVGEGPEETVAAVDAFTPAPGGEGPEETVATGRKRRRTWMLSRGDQPAPGAG